MKSKITHLFLMSGILAMSAAVSAQEPPSPKLVASQPGAVFVPTGFDNNDNVQMVLTGTMPNTCQKAGPVKVKVDKAGKRIKVKNMNYAYHSSWCLMMLVDYKKVVDVGVVPPGTYKIEFEDAKGSHKDLAALNIGTASTESADEFLYAPVREMALENRTATGLDLVLKGTFPSGCLTMHDVKVIHNDAHVFEILPIAAAGSDQECKDLAGKGTSFEQRVTLDGFQKGQSLIHIRALNGQSLNEVVDF